LSPPPRLGEGGCFSKASLLWALPAEWQEANQALEYLIRINDRALGPAKSLATTIQKNLETVFPILDHLNASTCPWCPDPCCTTAKVWFDFKDLLFLHLNMGNIPPAQLIKTGEGSCRYLGIKGCKLNRISRPWVCTWYLCPTQTAVLRKNSSQAIQTIRKTFEAVKDGRRKMEEEFIQVTSGKKEWAFFQFLSVHK